MFEQLEQTHFIFTLSSESFSY